MFLSDFDKSITAKEINRIFREHFNYDLYSDKLTPNLVQRILPIVLSKINYFRQNEQYFLGENNSKYMRLLTAARFLTSYIDEHTHNDSIVINESSVGLTAGKAIAKAKEAKQQSVDSLYYVLRNIAESYLVNIARIWIAKRPANTLMIDFGMGGVGIHINGKAMTNAEIDGSRWWLSVDETLRKICGDMFNFATPRTMEVKDGTIYFKGEETRRSAKKPVTEAPQPHQIRKVKANPYHAGTAKAIQHGVDTGVKIVPHVAGSALGAFVSGLKGQALHSEAGRVRVAKHDVDRDLGMIDPRNPQTIDAFAKKQAKEHFGQYDEKSQIAIAAYIKQLMKDGLENKKHTSQAIAANIAKITGNPLGNVTQPDKKMELINYFSGVNSGGASIRTQSAGGAKRIEPSIDKMRIESDVISALMNQGYKKKDAGRAVQMASGFADAKNFDGLFKSAMALLKKPTQKV